MARHVLSSSPGLTVGLDYNAGNGRITAIYATNGTGRTVQATAHLTDGRAFGQNVTPGEVLTSLPSNVATIAFPSAEEVVVTGVARLVVRG